MQIVDFNIIFVPNILYLLTYMIETTLQPDDVVALNGKRIVGHDPDYFLGPSEARYFGSTYKKTEHTIDNLFIQNELLIGDLNVIWPSLWSQKSGKVITPHLGTLDFFIVATRFVELYLKMVENREQTIIERIWVSDFFCKAGSRFIENSDVPCSCYKTSEIREDFVLKSTYEIKIDNSLIRITTIHFNEKDDEKSSSLSNIGAVSSIASLYDGQMNGISYFTEGYRLLERKISNIIIDEENRIICSDLELIGWGQMEHYGGLGVSHMPCISFCDLVLTTGQLSQILLFHLSGTNRDESSSLLLRSISCKYTTPIPPKTTVKATLLKSEIIKIKDVYYNSADLAFDFNNGDLIAESKTVYQIHNKK